MAIGPKHFLFVNPDHRVENEVCNAQDPCFQRGTVFGLFFFHFNLKSVQLEKFFQEKAAVFIQTCFDHSGPNTFYFCNDMFAFIQRHSILFFLTVQTYE